MMLLAIALAGAVTLAIAGVQVALHVAAARDAREREDRCAFDDPEEHTSVAAWCALTIGEIAATLCVGLWSLAPLGVRARDDDGRRSVVLVAGWGMPAGTTAWLAHRLRRAGWARVYPVRLGAWASVDDGVRRLDDALASLRATHAVGDVDVVAAGLSGLVARALLDRDGRRLRRLITLGTPHQGTLAAPWMPIGPWARDVRPDHVGVPEPDGDAIAIASAHDALLLPPTLAYWPGAFNVSLRGVGHVGMLCSARVWALVEENLAHAPAAAPGRTHVG
jgi:pimeloyl-ACP methyl ester carboxylesterase